MAGGDGLGEGVALDARLFAGILGATCFTFARRAVEGDELAVHVLVEGLLQGILVFLRQDRTRRIDERAARFEGPHGAVQKRALRSGALDEQLLGEAAQALFVAADDGARAGAGGVEQDTVKAEELVELACVNAHDGHVFGALAVEVGLELFGAGNAHLAGCEVCLALGEGGDLRRLAAGGRAHVQDVLACLGAQDQRRHHG